MSLQTLPPSTPLSPPYSPPPTSSVQLSQQLARIDTLHAQLKSETQRAQDFLQKLRRGELEAQMAVQLQQERLQQHKELERQQMQKSGKLDGDGNLCKCNCSHHPPPSANGHHAPVMSLSPSQTSLTMPTKVDEREVRDLEKRVRGLEGRVRGFEGLPPDREMALLEVERLRRELEGLAKRREGLFGEEAQEMKRNVIEAGKRVLGDDAVAKALARDELLAKTLDSTTTSSAGKAPSKNGRRNLTNGNKSTGKSKKKG